MSKQNVVEIDRQFEMQTTVCTFSTEIVPGKILIEVQLVEEYSFQSRFSAENQFRSKTSTCRTKIYTPPPKLPKILICFSEHHPNMVKRVSLIFFFPKRGCENLGACCSFKITKTRDAVEYE
jgi:hypothetical protein